MCWAQGGWGEAGGEEGGVLDGVEDVEVGEGADDGEEDDGLDGRVCGMEREGPEEKAHRRDGASSCRPVPQTFISNSRPILGTPSPGHPPPPQPQTHRSPFHPLPSVRSY